MDEVRQALAIDKPTRIKIEVKGKTAVITPIDSPALKLAGKYQKLHHKKPQNLNNIRDEVSYDQW